MTDYLAHSSRNGLPPQSYAEHIKNVKDRAVNYARESAKYNTCGDNLIEIVKQASCMHDLGKLNSQNQNTLHQTSKKRRLPINHVDAGSAYLANNGLIYAAITVYSHHKGLPNLSAEISRRDISLRDDHSNIRNLTNQELPILLDIHRNLIDLPPIQEQVALKGDYSMSLRMALSCLADADHSDTSGIADNENVPLKAEERLQALNNYEMKLCEENERSHLRHLMYESCRDADIQDGFASCDSPVGSGKTTAVMAHMLKQAQKRGARRIFVVLPFTNIIKQSVDVYRKALVLCGENPETVVAELHHRADFENEDIRRLTALWRAPIIVTTAAAFFETIASNMPSTLRRLHELPGSMIFVDETHAALPLRLLPLAWKWISILEQEWSCYWVLASGSLVRFWTISELTDICPKITELVEASLRDKLMSYELRRIDYLRNDKPQSIDSLVNWVSSMPGPRLVIMNTVQNAAVIADKINKCYGRNKVEHLSTALTGNDRAKSIEHIKRRLSDKADADWTLVATSCVEAGVDFSFRTGFREISSLLSLLQTAGRVGRGGEYPDTQVWSFSMQDSPRLNKNPDIKNAATVLKRYFDRKIKIEPALSTNAIKDELVEYDSQNQQREQLLEKEYFSSFKDIADAFNVIDSDTVPVVIGSDCNIANLFNEQGGDNITNLVSKNGVDWKLLQKHSVSISRFNLKKWNISEIKTGLYLWNLPYNDFIGYMAGVLSS